MSSFLAISFFVIIVLVSYSFKELEAQLEVGYYANTCGMAEYIVKDEVRNAFYRDPGLAAALVRLHFHDCFVRVSISKTIHCATRTAVFFFLYSIYLHVLAPTL